MIVEKGKGNKRRVIPISNGSVKDLENYYRTSRSELVNEKSEQAFMLHSQGGRMQKGTWNKYLKRIVQRTEKQRVEK